MKTKRSLLMLIIILICCVGCGIKKENSDIPLTVTISSESEQIPDSSKEVYIIMESEEILEKDDSFIDQETIQEQEIETLLQTMKLEEKIAQLFIVLPESLMSGVECVTAAGNTTKNAINNIPVGGFIYLSQNLKTKEQVQTMLNNVQDYSIERIGVPAFLCVDEEGGSVTRISGTGKFDVPVISDMSVIGQTQDINAAYEIGKDIGEYLFDLGFNVDFAPVADVLTNKNNKVVKLRSFGSEPELVSNMSQSMIKGLEEQGIYGTYKHFPGHGATTGDTHEGYAYTEKTLEELKANELIPFQDGIDNGVSFIMVGHISLPNIIGDNTPASLSEYMITEVLRNEMGYNGIVITDAMNMGAIVQQYSSADAAVKALQAGVDIILMPQDFIRAYQGVLDAVKNGVLSNERIDESLRRILSVKLKIEKTMQTE